MLLEGCIDTWPALQKWSRDYLLEISAGKEFAVGPVSMPLDRYFRYADNVQEERLLYLFDAKFAENVPEMGRDYLCWRPWRERVRERGRGGMGATATAAAAAWAAWREVEA